MNPPTIIGEEDGEEEDREEEDREEEDREEEEEEEELDEEEVDAEIDEETSSAQEIEKASGSGMREWTSNNHVLVTEQAQNLDAAIQAHQQRRRPHMEKRYNSKHKIAIFEKGDFA